MLDTIIAALLPIVITLLLGMLAGWHKDFSAAQAGQLNRMVMLYALPLSLFSSMVLIPRHQLLSDGWLFFLVSLGMIGGYAAAFILSWKVFKRERGIAALQALAIAGPAVPFVGVPVLGYLYGNDSAVAIAIASILMNMIQVPFTMVMLTASAAQNLSGPASNPATAQRGQEQASNARAANSASTNTHPTGAPASATVSAAAMAADNSISAHPGHPAGSAEDAARTEQAVADNIGDRDTRTVQGQNTASHTEDAARGEDNAQATANARPEHAGKANGKKSAHFQEFMPHIISAIKEPVVWAPFIALILIIAGVTLPKALDDSLALLGKATGGVALFASGVVLFSQKVKVSKAVILSVLSRNIVIPLFILLVAMLLRVPQAQNHEAVLTMAIPTASIVVILAVQFKKAEQEMASTLFISTILSVLTMGMFIAITR